MVLPTLDFEEKLWSEGFKLVCGMDEVGRGSFAGPVVVGAVIFPPGVKVPKGVADSKLLTPKKREILSEEIKRTALFWTIGEISVADIDTGGIGKAVQMGFRKALELFPKGYDFVLIDAFYVNSIDKQIQNPIQGGDKLCASISAASIVAKVYRDKLMEELHIKHPQYLWCKNKGYGTRDHREAIKKHGLCPYHRRSFNLEKFT